MDIEPRDLDAVTHDAEPGQAAPREAPVRPEPPVASNVRKAQVRATLFQKLGPVRIGRFALLEPLGSGAMGEVYAAYDEQLDRKVALKLMRSGVDPIGKPDERMLREAQTLAQVSHPNVVHIYDAGRYNGRLFIAMELVRGKTLSSWLRDTAQLSRAVRQREVLRQFVAAGRGLEAAHAAGVAHRDFKPDNVLVGDDGRVRVVDFGLARALTDEDTAPVAGVDGEPLRRRAIARGSTPPMTDGVTLEMSPAALAATCRRGRPQSGPLRKAALQLTETGTIMGTPSYMAPEQMRGAIADLRSDQFSFCVALYHALYGTFPFAGKTLRELQNAMASDKIAFAPGASVPGFVRRALLRGLSIEPSQRFASMGELLAAIEPRHPRARGWTMAAASLATAALVAIVASQPATDPCTPAIDELDASWSAEHQRAVNTAFTRSELPFADLTWRGVKARLDDYTRRWRDKAISTCKATQVTDAPSARRPMLCLARGKNQLIALVTALEFAGADAVDRAIAATEQLPDPSSCPIENIQAGLEPPPPAIASKVAAIRDHLARALVQQSLGHAEESLRLAREAEVAARPLGYPPVRAEALAQIADALDTRGTRDQGAETERLYFEALDIAEARRHDQLAAEIWNRLVMLAVQRGGDMTLARAWSQRNTAAVERLGDAPYEQAKLHHALGELNYEDGEYANVVDEEHLVIEALEREHGSPHQLELSRSYDRLAKSREQLGEIDEAVRHHERAVEIARKALGPIHRRVIELQDNYEHLVKLQLDYGMSATKHGQINRARAELQTALDGMPARYRNSHPDAALHGFLSRLDYRQGNLDHAAAHGRKSLEILRRTPPPDEAHLAVALANLADIEFKRRNFRDALALHEEELALRRRTLGDRNDLVGFTEGSLAETLFELSRYDEAMAHLVKAEQVFGDSFSRRRWIEAWLMTVRGAILTGQRRFGAATRVLERATQLFDDGVQQPVNRALAMWTLACVIHKLGGDPDRVRSLATRAHTIFASQRAAMTNERDATAGFLERLTASGKRTTGNQHSKSLKIAIPVSDP